ncbi:MAG: universal stress protein [Streptosporangiaceae bacterium]
MDTAPSQPTPEPRGIIARGPASPVVRVVIGVDGSAGAAAALQWAVAEAYRREVTLCIISAWEEPNHAGRSLAADPARIAAARVQKALARVLGRPHYPRRIACLTPKGRPGRVLLNEVGEAGLLVLGLTAIDAASVPGRVNRYCLRRGRGPLVFVPAMPTV